MYSWFGGCNSHHAKKRVDWYGKTRGQMRGFGLEVDVPNVEAFVRRQSQTFVDGALPATCGLPTPVSRGQGIHPYG